MTFMDTTKEANLHVRQCLYHCVHMRVRSYTFSRRYPKRGVCGHAGRVTLPLRG